MIIRIALLVGIVFLIGGCEPLKNVMDQSPPELVIDMGAVAKALGRDVAMDQELKNNEQQLQAQLAKIAENLRAQVDKETKRLGKKPSKKDRQRLQQLNNEAQQRFRNEQRAAQQKMAMLRSDLLSRFRDEVKSVAVPIAKKQGGKVVKLLNADTLWYDAKVDITDEIIAQMRAANQNVSKSAETPAP